LVNTTAQPKGSSIDRSALQRTHGATPTSALPVHGRSRRPGAARGRPAVRPSTHSLGVRKSRYFARLQVQHLGGRYAQHAAAVAHTSIGTELIGCARCSRAPRATSGLQALAPHRLGQVSVASSSKARSACSRARDEHTAGGCGRCCSSSAKCRPSSRHRHVDSTTRRVVAQPLQRAVAVGRLAGHTQRGSVQACTSERQPRAREQLVVDDHHRQRRARSDIAQRLRLLTTTPFRVLRTVPPKGRECLRSGRAALTTAPSRAHGTGRRSARSRRRAEVVQQAQAFAHVEHRDAGAGCRRRVGQGVADDHRALPVWPDAPRTTPPPNEVRCRGDGVFHKRLQHQRRHTRPARWRVNLPAHGQAIAEAHLLDREIALCEVDLLASVTDEPTSASATRNSCAVSSTALGRSGRSAPAPPRYSMREQEVRADARLTPPRAAGIGRRALRVRDPAPTPSAANAMPAKCSGEHRQAVHRSMAAAAASERPPHRHAPSPTPCGALPRATRAQLP